MDIIEMKIMQNSKQINDLTSKGTIVFDQTLNNPWIAGLVADSTTNTFTATAHGYSNGMPIEFTADTGVLPTNVLPFDSDTSGGTYYNVINVTANTFQICDTVGGTTPLSFTTNGTGSWKFRKAGLLSPFFTGFDVNALGECDMYVIFSCVKITTATMSAYYRPNNNDSNMRLNKYFSVLGYSNDFIQKYSSSMIKMTFKTLGTNEYLFNSSVLGIDTNETKSNNVSRVQYVNSGVVSNVTAGNITGITVGSNNSAILLIRNGARLIVVKR